MRAIILAAGKCERFGGKVKQLLPVNGEPIILRTIRQLKENGVCDIKVVSNRPEIQEAMGEVYLPSEHSGVVGAIDACRDLWETEQQRVVFLLSDVVWTDEAIKSVVNSKAALAFFASEVETFAISVQDAEKSRFAHSLLATIANRGKSSWMLYRTCVGFPIHMHRFEDVVHQRISDKTDDIDFPDEYSRRVACGYYKDMGGKPQDIAAPVKTVAKRKRATRKKKTAQ